MANPYAGLGEPVEPATADLAVLGQSTAVMVQLLLRCIERPLDPAPLRDALDVQQLLAPDVGAAACRLGAVQP